MLDAPEIVLLDDGELTDVQQLLEQLGAACVVVRGSAGERIPRPRTLLIASARRAQALAQTVLRAGSDACWTAACDGNAPGRPASLVFTAEDSPTLRALLREAGFDLLVRRPVHPTVLRLLVARALYDGPERRRGGRIAIGDTVSYWTGVQRRSAVLTDLSLHGGRLAVRYGARRGMRLRLEIPGAAADGAPLGLDGRVVRCRSAGEGASSEELSLAVEFLPLAEDQAQALAAWLEARQAQAETGIAEAAPAPGARPRERRQHRRASYQRPVVLLRDEAGRALLGRDLSVTGMRLESHPGLHVGEQVKLALYGNAGGEPSIVDATVVRDDGERGVALRFGAMPAVVERRLEAIVASLPGVESLADGEADALGAVVAQILRA